MSYSSDGIKVKVSRLNVEISASSSSTNKSALVLARRQVPQGCLFQYSASLTLLLILIKNYVAPIQMLQYHL